MRAASLILSLALVGAAAADAAGVSGPEESLVALGNEETVVFYGDSITEQNLYSAYLETFLLGRFPDKRIATFNFGWGGDTARGGAARFGRDVAPVDPTLVFVNFGMNDGGYKAFEPAIYEAYLETQGALADAIAAAGARQVLFTASPIDPDRRPDGDVYNGTLSRLAEGLSGLARERGIPLIDLFTPMRDVQRRAKAADPEFTMIPDSVHPDAVGHLVMAYVALRAIEAPRTAGGIVIEGDAVTASDGAVVRNVARGGGGLSFDLELPFVPFYVPPDARPALELVPFQRELNRLELRATLPGGDAAQWVLSADGATLGPYSATELAAGIDLALADGSPWSEAGRRLWEAAQYRWAKHQEAWRYMGLQPEPTMLPRLDTFAALAATQRAHANAMGRHLASLARPGRYHLRLSRLGESVALGAVHLSPTYPFDADFERAHAPESAASEVEWTRAELAEGRIDLGAHFTGAANVVAYARVRVEADAECGLHLSLGSDDGLAVFLDGKRVFANDAYRSLRRGDDEVLLTLSPGPHDLLFKVTQGGGDFGLDVQARVYGTATVRQLD